ncbi:hypothetical protein [Nitrosomonas mobilis]|uniref:hypothetical protein n=1 Tax=Nitrosomonas mobilis TaxID=51642 RepID=UPI00115FCBE2|nr:hypothetical protein [Nitrosomonas mobilis]
MRSVLHQSCSSKTVSMLLDGQADIGLQQKHWAMSLIRYLFPITHSTMRLSCRQAIPCSLAIYLLSRLSNSSPLLPTATGFDITGSVAAA